MCDDAVGVGVGVLWSLVDFGGFLLADLMPSTFSPNDAVGKETLPESSPVGSTEGSSTVRKRKGEHTGDDDRMSSYTSLTLIVRCSHDMIATHIETDDVQLRI